MSNILIAEDDRAIHKMLELNLTLTGYTVCSAYDGQEVLDILAAGNGHIDLAVVDVMMPRVDGFALLEPLMAHGIPVIYLTAKSDLESRMKGLLGGAEDYMVKPFDVPELLVRMEKVLKRYQREDTYLQLADIQVDIKERRVMKSGQVIDLTPLEFDLLIVFARNRNAALTREKLLAEVWDITYEGGTRTVDVHVAQLRKKTGLHIASVPKIGYRLEV